jgi:hypothetical protein
MVYNCDFLTVLVRCQAENKIILAFLASTVVMSGSWTFETWLDWEGWRVRNPSLLSNAVKALSRLPRPPPPLGQREPASKRSTLMLSSARRLEATAMKVVMIVIALAATFGSGLEAQEVSPLSIDFEQVLVGQTSPQHDVRFKNTGNSDLTVTLSITGPFGIPVNKCGRGVKAGTHCNVFVTYTPEAVGTDAGTLTFTDSEGNVENVSLAGSGATTVPTQTTLKADPNVLCDNCLVTFTSTTMSPSGEVPPDGEQVLFNCYRRLGGGGWSGMAPTQGGVATIQTTRRCGPQMLRLELHRILSR